VIRVRIGAEEHELSWEEWERRVRDGRVPPDALVQFEAVTGTEWIPARDLELYRSLRNDAAIAWRSAFTSGPPPLLTALLVGVQVRVWWFARVDDVRGWLLGHFTNWAGPALENGEVWRPLTMGFLHADLFHLVLNMLWLAYTGWNIERALGRKNLLTIYVGSVVGGAVLSMFGSPQTPSLGASGGVFGLVAASTVFGFVRPELLPERGRRLFGAAMLPYLVLMFWSGLMNEDTDNWSHFGGLVVGAILAFALDPAPLQRRPGWNARFQAAVAGGIAVTLAVCWAGGPRLMPLVDSELARAHANPRRRLPTTDPGERELRWSVPAGWRPARDLAGMPGFSSRAGDRSFGVRQRAEDRLTTTEELAEAWVTELREDWPELKADATVDSTLADRPALSRRVVPDPNQGVEVYWIGTARGTYTLEASWVVESDMAGRLAPMHQRMKDAIAWADPDELQDARAEVAFRANSVEGRMALAEALGKVGDTEEALSLHRQLIEEAPDDPKRWVALLDTAALGGVSPADREQIWRDALAATPSPRVVTTIAHELEDAGHRSLARGLLEVAWQRRPGDRRLRRARRSLDLPVELTPLGEPWSRTYDPLTGEVRPPTRPAPAPRLDLDEAERVGAALHARDEAVVQAACAALEARDAGAAWPPLLWLRDGRLPEPGSDVPQAVLDELTDANPGRWVPPAVLDCVPADLSEWLGPELAPRVPGRG